MKKNKSNKLKLTSAEMESAGIRSAVMLLDAAHTLSSPLLRSIENLLQVSADAVNASEGSVIVRDGNKGALRFLSAIGPVADKLLKVKIPPGKGIAGFVYSSGQRMTVTNAAEEESFYAEVDKTTGYTTQSLLATPVKMRNEVIGVLE